MTRIDFSVTRKAQSGEPWWVGGRNGTAQCGGIAAWTFEYPGSPLTVHLDLLSSKHQAIAGGGGSFPPELLDEFCRQWLAARQEVKQYECYSHCPRCGAPLEGGPVEVGPDSETTQEVWCTACDWRGTDRYLLLGYEDSEWERRDRMTTRCLDPQDCDQPFLGNCDGCPFDGAGRLRQDLVAVCESHKDLVERMDKLETKLRLLEGRVSRIFRILATIPD